MTDKWKEFSTITGLGIATISGEIGWTAFLACSASKIPYIGFTISVILGTVGVMCAIWMGNSCAFAYTDWYKKHYTKE